MSLQYRAPDGSPSSIDGVNGKQMATFHYLRKAIITARKKSYFSQLSNTTQMPRNFGKTIKVHEYVPLLDDRNVNDQGINAAGVTIANGNLYGSSKDVGTINGKLPTLSENGGRVNRVGWTRITREGSLFKFGFFTEFTAESMQFDSDPMLKEHIAREMLNGAFEIYEDVLQRDLLAGAGVIAYSGAAVSKATVTGVSTPASGATPAIPASIVTYAGLMRLDQILTDNRTPTQTTIVTGSRYQDTKTINSARYMYVGSELVPLLRAMQDTFGNKAFIECKHYADATTLAEGEIGSIDNFRIILVPEMLNYAGAGATAPVGTPYRTTTVAGQSKFNVYPLLVVGDDSFVTIGFTSDGASGKFTVKTLMPNESITQQDPYAETGMSSIKWYYGSLIKRPERIAVLYTVAPI